MYAVIGHLDINEAPNIKLPSRSIDCLHLYWHKTTGFADCDDVVIGNISRKWSSNETEPAEFRCNKELAYRAREFG